MVPLRNQTLLYKFDHLSILYNESFAAAFWSEAEPLWVWSRIASPIHLSSLQYKMNPDKYLKCLHGRTHKSTRWTCCFRRSLSPNQCSRYPQSYSLLPFPKQSLPLSTPYQNLSCTYSIQIQGVNGILLSQLLDERILPCNEVRPH
jgi:hypothetical protein